MHHLEPELKPVAIANLRPTQMTIGKREVEQKRAAWARRAEKDGPDFLGRHLIPAVAGPKGQLYIIDHHHLVRALHEEGVEKILVSLVADLSKLDKILFWTFMENRNWLHPYNANGERMPHSDIPKSIGKLTDDPYRSLAGMLRETGYYAKDMTPYAEFLWADYLRRKIDAKALAKDFEAAVKKAQKLAHAPAANYLPGWCGPNRS